MVTAAGSSMMRSPSHAHDIEESSSRPSESHKDSFYADRPLELTNDATHGGFE